MKKNYQLFGLLSTYAVILIFSIFFFDGTGDSGDSIMHYLFAKFAPKHPMLYFNHWAKPLFVLLASPFAQFRFTGIKIFNSIVSLFTLFFTYKTAQKLNINNAFISTIILFCSPLYFVLTFSGLTEPLFGLVLIISIYLLLIERTIIACILISFHPFVRSEGLIIIGIFGLYLLIKKEWKLIPLLLCGHLVYSIIGFLVHGDLLWVFNKIPYAHLSSLYGDGKLFHFVSQMNYVVGIPIYVLLGLGIVSIVLSILKKEINLELLVLILFGFLSFFVAHSLFWYLGIFGSMGLKRVLVGILPLTSIISLIGFNFLTETFIQEKSKIKLGLQSLIILYIIIFPLTPNPAAIKWDVEMKLSKDQQLAHEVANFITQQNLSNQRFVFAHPYLSEVLNIDYFDNNQSVLLSQHFRNQLKKGDIIIWDDWFGYVENSITKEQLDDDIQLTNLHHFSIKDKGRSIQFAIYQKK